MSSGAHNVFVVDVDKARIRFTVVESDATSKSWDSGVQVDENAQLELDSHFNIKWSTREFAAGKLNIQDSCLFIAATAAIAGEHDITYVAHGSAYWLFHDIVHARLDTRHVDGTFFTVDSLDLIGEDKVFALSSKFANRHGISEVEIKTEIDTAKREPYGST